MCCYCASRRPNSAGVGIRLASPSRPGGGPARRGASRPSPCSRIHPCSPRRKSVLPSHPHRRDHPREAVDHHAQQCPVPEADHRPGVDSVEGRPRLRRRQHLHRALRHDGLRTLHRRGRVHRQHLVDDEPVAEPGSRPGGSGGRSRRSGDGSLPRCPGPESQRGRPEGRRVRRGCRQPTV